jgi:hypothetical protein
VVLVVALSHVSVVHTRDSPNEFFLQLRGAVSMR